MKYPDLIRHYKQHDKMLYMSAALLEQKHGKKVLPYAKDILSFISHRRISDPLTRYSYTNRDLIKQQREFNKSGHYSSNSYKSVQPIDRDLYNLRLLLSFIVANHRFEILDMLVKFLAAPNDGPQSMLIIGFGTGYEIKLAYDHLPHSHSWQITTFDCSFDAINYSRDLLCFFNCPTEALQLRHFPLEASNGGDQYRDRFGKIIMCEVLEHLENPKQALQNLRKSLHPNGQIFLTMAINIAQEDHIYLYKDVTQARKHVVESILTVVEELITPATIFPFKDDEREDILKSGNYVCIAQK